MCFLSFGHFSTYSWKSRADKLDSIFATQLLGYFSQGYLDTHFQLYWEKHYFKYSIFVFLENSEYDRLHLNLWETIIINYTDAFLVLMQKWVIFKFWQAGEWEYWWGCSHT